MKKIKFIVLTYTSCAHDFVRVDLDLFQLVMIRCQPCLYLFAHRNTFDDAISMTFESP